MNSTKKTFKQVHGVAIGTKFAPLYTILLMDDLEEKILNVIEEGPIICCRNIDDIFLLGNMEKNLWKNSNSFHPTIKFTADYSKE